MSLDSSMERLPPERRFRLYNRLAEVFRDAGMEEAREKCLAEAHQAARESPEIQAELRHLLDALRGDLE